MERFLACTCVLVATAVAVASGPDPQTSVAQGDPAIVKAGDPAQEDASRRKQGEAVGESNMTLPQPKRIEQSYPLKSDEDRHKSVKGLQQLTVDLLAVVNTYKEAHWNVSGPLYLPLHEYYDAQADFYRAQSDVFAERVLHLGSSVDGRYPTITRTTTIPEMPAGYLSDDDTLKLLLDRITVLQKEIYKLLRDTEESDPPTSNKLQDLAYSVDKNLWQLRSHLQKPGGQGEDLPWIGHRPQ
jgi:starvation-inducible DNA-binding protein